MVDHRGIDVTAGQTAGQLLGVGPGETAEADLGGTVDDLQSSGESPEGVAVVEVLATDGADDQQWAGRVDADEIVDELQPRLVAPLRVVGDQQCRPPGRCERPADGVEQLASLLGGVQRRGRWHIRSISQLGDKAGQLCEIGPSRPPELDGRVGAPEPGDRHAEAQLALPG